jgi:hypothetical protein
MLTTGFGSDLAVSGNERIKTLLETMRDCMFSFYMFYSKGSQKVVRNQAMESMAIGGFLMTVESPVQCLDDLDW